MLQGSTFTGLGFVQSSPSTAFQIDNRLSRETEEAILVSMALLSTKLPRFFSENAVNATVGGGGGNDAEE